jgi:hypothetical protein
MESDAVYCSLGEYERHFNTIQAGFRAVASTWLLATFAAIGLILRPDDNSQLLLSPSSLVVGACFLGSIGLVLLWILDQMVYQRLLGAVFVAGLSMETQSKDLPKVRALMIHRFRGKGASRLIAWFYAVPIGILVLVSVVAALSADPSTVVRFTSVVLPERLLLWGGVMVEAILLASIAPLGQQQGAKALAIKMGPAMQRIYEDEARQKYLEDCLGAVEQPPPSPQPEASQQHA